MAVFQFVDSIGEIFTPVSDTFTRTESNGWGTSDSGHAWATSGGSAADYSVGSGTGSVSLAAVNTRHFTFTGAFTDVDMLAEVTVPVTATGERNATVVVQGYVAPIASSAKRPPKELKVWTKAVVTAGTTWESVLEFGRDAFHHWDTATGSWIVEPGEYDLVIASAADREHARIRITVTA